MGRVLRAFVWLRWRVLINSLERSGGRDRLERLSLAVEQLAPAVLLLVMLPSAAVLAGAGAYAGWHAAIGTRSAVAEGAIRVGLLAGFVMALGGPVVLPTGHRPNPIRLLLLPIPRWLLYAGGVLSSAADPWMLLVGSLLAGVTAGFVLGGTPASAAAAAAAGLLVFAVFAGTSSLMTYLLQVLVRSRRRGELLALIGVLLFPLAGLLPGLLDGEMADTAAAEPDDAPRAAATTRAAATWRAMRRVAWLVLPSEQYAAILGGLPLSAAAVPIRAAVTLCAVAVGVHLLAYAAFRHALRSPAAGSRRRIAARAAHRTRRLPGLSAAASAVALNQLRLGWRTPRGRSTLLSPVVVFAVFALLVLRLGPPEELAWLGLQSGIGLATSTAFIALLAILPIAMNQFAIDGGGVTRMQLVPLATRDLVAGKAVGNGLIAAGPMALCFVLAAWLSPTGGALALWASVPLALVSTYLLAAPVAAMLSAIFPRAVDLNSIGNGSNAHGVAGLLGTATFVAAGLPNMVLVFVATAVFDAAVLAPIFLTAWMALSAALSVPLFRAAVRIFDARREQIAGRL